jgi:hypothetical protein
MSFPFFAVLTWCAVAVIVYYVVMDIRSGEVARPSVLAKIPVVLDKKHFLPYSELVKKQPVLNESTERSLPPINATGGYMINLGAPLQPEPSPEKAAPIAGAEFFTSEPLYVSARNNSAMPVPPPTLRYSKPVFVVTNSAAFKNVKERRKEEYTMDGVEYSDQTVPIFASA